MYKKISIIIPVYNEDKYISKVLQRVIKANTLGLMKEIVTINDGSTDSTEEVIKRFIKVNNNKKVKIVNIKLKKNCGKGYALKKGFLKSFGDIVIIQDADLEYNPNDYPNLIEPFLNNDVDVVYGSRFISSQPHRVLYFWHYVINVLLTTLSNMLTNINLTDIETGYKVFNGDLIRRLAKKLQSKRFGFEPEITARIAKIPDLKIFEVGISYSGRTYQEGKKIGWKDGLLAIFEIIKYNLFTKR